MSKVLVIGGTGFLGAALCNYLSLHGWNVSSYSRRLPAESDRHASVRYLASGEGADGVLDDEIRKSEIVFNLANANIPSRSNEDIMDDITRAVGLNLSIMQSCLKYGIQSYIFASSGGTVYGEPDILPISEDSPTNPVVAYGVNKLVCEKYINLFHHNYGLNYRILRIANPFGPGQSPFTGQGIIAKYIYTALKGEEFTVFGDGSSVRDYIYIDDVSRAFEAAARYQGSKRVFNVGRGQGSSINELIECLSRISGVAPKIRYVDQRAIDVKTNYLDVSLIAKECAWTPNRSLEDGLAETFEAIKTRYFPNI